MKTINEIRADFPILKRLINKQPLIYFDNGATSQTPVQVVDRIVQYYSYENANIHRGVHTLSQEATDLYEQARQKLQKHFNAQKSSEILFTAGTTHAINLVASGYGALMQAGDEVIVSASEHHSNIVPWQLACQRSGAILKVIPMNEYGILDLEAYSRLLTERTKIVCVQHVSNALGNIHPVKEIIELAHQRGAVVIVDGAQAAPHLQIDVQALDVDFYADTSLPIVSDGVQKFFDNRVKVRIIRKDGTDFFNKTFSKSNFLSYLSSSLGKNGALLGVVFDRAEGDYVYFAASIGSPDKSSDEYVPLIVRVSRFGDVYISKDTMLDTGSDVESMDEDA